MAYGAKLRPGALRAFGVQEPWHLTNSSSSCAELFGKSAVGPDGRDAGPEAGVASLADYLAALRPRSDHAFDEARGLAEWVARDRSVVSVGHMVRRFGMAERTLQGLFRRTLGVSPKWVIRCHRLQEALVRLRDRPLDLSRLAQELGYFDQAHFARDFRAIAGIAPGAYAVGTNRSSQPSSSMG